MNSTTWKQKIGLAIFGVFVAFVALELVLRLGGFLFFLKQEMDNRHLSRSGQLYTILCLGESTTALGGEQSYPRQLERLLNEGSTEMKVRVINKGIPATVSAKIVQNLPGYLKEYKPDMVVVMMGINDGLSYISSKEGDILEWKRFFYSLRIVKLFRLLEAHLNKKSEDIQEEDPTKRLEEMERNVDPTVTNLILLARFYRAATMPAQEIRALQRALDKEPKNYIVLDYMGEHFKRLGDYPNAIKYFQESLEAFPLKSPMNLYRYATLAEVYKLSGRYDLAEEAFKKAITQRPDHPGAYGGLGELYLEQGRRTEARRLFEKQITVNPKAAMTYGRLAYCYRQDGDKELAKKILLEGIRQNPDEITLYTDVAYNFTDDNQQPMAENVIAHAIEFKLTDDKGLLGEWFQYCKSKGIEINNKELKEWFESKKGTNSKLTVANYKNLRDFLHEKRIKLVAVQYPMRDVRALKDLLDNVPYITYVDNEASFKEAVDREGFDTYFSDRFAGDFGHCTVKGNALLAHNIARAIQPFIFQVK